MPALHPSRRLGALLFAVATAAAGCARPAAVATLAPLPPEGGIPATWRFGTPPAPARGREAMVASGHPLATEVGVAILRRGGNAIDAAVAVGFALAVVLPAAGNIGGGGFLVYRDAQGRVLTLDYRETAPAAATPTMYLDSAGNPTGASLTGALAAGVPGAVAGLAEMHARLGRLPWRELVMPAVALAREGFVVDSVRALSLAEAADRLARFPGSAAQFLPGGRPPQPGEVLRQGDLARTLELIADSGAAGFYRGRIVDLIVEEMRESGGLISRADLAGYRARWRKPITTSYRGWRVISMPPASSGGVTLTEILNIMEGFRPLPPFGSAELAHLEVEAMRRAFEDRNRYLGDPDFVAMPLRRLLSKRYAAGLRHAIDPARATPTEPAAADATVPREGTHTTHYSVVDGEGNAAAVTTTLNDSYGSAVTVRGAGFLLNDEMDDFTTKPGTPNLYGLVQGAANAIRPGKRMLSAMTPTIVLDPRGRLALVLGSPGGPAIITTVYHVLSNVIDHGMSLSLAVAAPRIHHQGRPDRIAWEPDGLSPWVVETLERMGHSLAPRARWLGDIQAIRVGPDGLEGVADPRRGGGAAGY